MTQRNCRFCKNQFEPSRFHPEQAVCSHQQCQQRRRSESRKRKLDTDAEYRQVCRDSARKWRARHPDYWTTYRAANPASTQHNCNLQRKRDLRQRLVDLANNNSALNLKSSVAAVWWVGPAAVDLANNNLATAQIIILEGLPRIPPLPVASCKQHPSGLPPLLA